MPLSAPQRSGQSSHNQTSSTWVFHSGSCVRNHSHLFGKPHEGLQGLSERNFPGRWEDDLDRADEIASLKAITNSIRVKGVPALAIHGTHDDLSSSKGLVRIMRGSQIKLPGPSECLSTILPNHLITLDILTGLILNIESNLKSGIVRGGRPECRTRRYRGAPQAGRKTVG